MVKANETFLFFWSTLHHFLPVSKRVNLPVAIGVVFCTIVDMRKRTKRKVWGLVNPIFHAIEGAAVTTEPEMERLSQGEYLALESFRMGQAVDEDWQLLSVMTAISGLMAYEGLGVEALPIARIAWKSLDSIEKRKQKTGKWGCTGPELQSLREMCEYHDLQRQSVARSVYEGAIFRSKGVLQDPVRRRKVLESE